MTMATLDRTHLQADPHRPQFHYLPPANWMNDPNGLIQWNGQYHLFYQYNPDATAHGNIHWGHAASHDLVHWTDLPIALAPTPDSPDQSGCWSGCAVNHDGTPTILYTGFNGGEQRPCIAFGDANLIRWRKHPGNPVVEQPPAGLELVGFRDHSLWREDAFWYQVIGSGLVGLHGTVLLYRSRDLLNWEYLHQLVAPMPRWPSSLFTGSMWECPSFFALDGKHVLIISVWDKGVLNYVTAFTGRYSGHHFVPETLCKLDAGDRCFYAPQTMLDDQGRRLMWGWLQEGRSRAAQLEAGWSGVMSLPRMINLDEDGILRADFVPELQALRGNRMHGENLEIRPDEAITLNLADNQAEIIIRMKRQEYGRSGLWVSRSPDGREGTLIYVDWLPRKLVGDRTKSSLDLEVDQNVCIADVPDLAADVVRLHVYVDHSTLEVNLDGRAWISTRIYPTLSDSTQLCLWSETQATIIRSVDAWPLRSIW